MVFKCWHIESWWIVWPVNVRVIFVFICCVLVLLVWDKWATIYFCYFTTRKVYLLVSGTVLFICMSLYVLNMSFMESIILGCPNCSWMGLYRVDRTTFILCTSFFAGESLLGELPCFTSTSCTSLGLFLWCWRRYTSSIAWMSNPALASQLQRFWLF